MYSMRLAVFVLLNVPFADQSILLTSTVARAEHGLIVAGREELTAGIIHHAGLDSRTSTAANSTNRSVESAC
jgi:hypothetical protein